MNGEDEQLKDNRPLPQNDLDLQFLFTDPAVGKIEVPEEVKEKLMQYFVEYDEEGRPHITKQSLWGLYGMYTRDMRLANLSEWNNELQTCRYMIDLAHDLLLNDYPRGFMVALSRAVTIMETSQSKDGFLRRKMNTLTNEHINQNLEPPKKSFFGGKPNNGGY